MEFPIKHSQDSDSDMATLVQGNSSFALDLYTQLKSTEGNLLFSPYSISVALTMTYAGARGATETQMADVLHLSLMRQAHQAFSALSGAFNRLQQGEGLLLEIANSLWPHVDYPFLEEFLALVKQHYGVAITGVDYRNPETARQIINTWVAEKTAAKIPELIPSGFLDGLTRLVLVNAVYFKGTWANQFDSRRTMEMPFWVTSDKVVQVPMMQQTATFGYGETENIQVLELPYLGNQLSMVVLLPKQRNGLRQLEGTLAFKDLIDSTKQLYPQEVRVLLPRFKANSQFRLDDTLSTMGMSDAFDLDKANFSGMDGRENWLYIGSVFHQAFIDVNEEGSEAAAATAVEMRIKGISLPPPLPVFRADHPFIFLIRENSTGSILFLGRYVEPEKE